MAERRRHGVSEGQDGRSERPETRQGQSLAAWFLFMLVCFVGHPAAAEDAAAPSAGLAAQERARAIAAELVRGVIDGQLQQLEENGLADRPLHADILALRGTIDSLVQREMQEVIDLLGRADAAAPAERREMIGVARTRARAIVTRLAAERQQVVRRLKEATLAAEARSVLERQTRLLKTTESLPALPDGRREQTMLAAIEASRAGRVLVTHGFADVLARFLRERGLDAEPLATRFTGEAPPDAASDEHGEPDEHDEPDAKDGAA